MNKHYSTPQAEFEAFSVLPRGTEVWRQGEAVIKTALVPNYLVSQPETAPKVLGFIVLHYGYKGHYTSLVSALNVGLGKPVEEAQAITRAILGGAR